jgi:hypothetical protein
MTPLFFDKQDRTIILKLASVLVTVNLMSMIDFVKLMGLLDYYDYESNYDSVITFWDTDD